MTEIYCIVGLPGSGKTYLATQLLKPYSIIIDDIVSIEELPKDGLYNLIIINDPYFCLSSTRNMAEEVLLRKYGNINWIFFENNKEKALKNVKFRNDGRKVKGLIEFLSQNYFIPDEDIPYIVEIWQPK